MQMHFSGQEAVEAPPSVVWAFVSDPQRVAACLPGVQEVRVVGDGALEVTVPLSAGFLRGQLVAQVQITPQPEQGTVGVSIRGGGLGSQLQVQAHSDVVNTGDGRTRLDWRGDADLGGPLAKLGGRAIEGRVQEMISRTFRTMSAQMAQGRHLT